MINKSVKISSIFFAYYLFVDKKRINFAAAFREKGAGKELKGRNEE